MRRASLPGARRLRRHHCSFKTTLIYADYAPSGHEVGLVERALSQELGPNWAPAPAEAERPTDPH
jgi:hypothetical protein